MKIKFKNLGYLEEGQINIGDLTIICGKNNTGKTYINYALYGFLRNLKDHLEFNVKKNHIEELLSVGYAKINLTEYESQIKSVINKALTLYNKSLYKTFSSNEESFSKTEFELEFSNLKPNYERSYSLTLSSQKRQLLKFSKEENSKYLEITYLIDEDSNTKLPEYIAKDGINNAISDIYFNKIIKKPYIITSERTGISLFYKELDINKNVFLERIQNRKKIEKIDFLKMMDESISRYAISIQDNIDIIRDFDTLSKGKSFLCKDRKFTKYFEIILGGSFKHINNSIYFVQKLDDKKNEISIPLHATSSAVKSLLLFDLYIKHIANENNFLLIDEPELNLHPENQRRIARLIVRLVNKGIKVIMTTHSDIIIREINNLIMLNSINEPNKLYKKFKYSQEETINKEKVKVYTTIDRRIEESIIDDYGIKIDGFEEIFTDLTIASEEIYFSLLDSKEK
jgi:predicted ATPase